MRNNRKTGFTLVEILIVVVILGILAAIVVPQFTSASSEAIKGALQTQLQTINTQVELYRVRTQGDYPHFDTTGWDDLTTNEYLKEEPINGYTQRTGITTGGLAAAEAYDRDTGKAADMGWTYQDTTGTTDYFTVYAAAYDPNSVDENGNIAPTLAHEDNYLNDTAGS